jgi:hypothetical protein
MKRSARGKLALDRETLVALAPAALEAVQGGAAGPPTVRISTIKHVTCGQTTTRPTNG